MKALAFHVVLVCGLAAAMADGHASPIDRLVRGADAAEFALREAATLELAVSPEFSLKDLEGVLMDAPLTLEQRSRLLAAARARFDRGPRAALGVEFANNNFAGGIPNPEPDNGLVLRRVFPNFPSAAVLLPGDRIEELNGEPVRITSESTASFRPLVISRDPGDVVRVRVVRNGEHLTLDVPLGRYTDLPRSQSLSDREVAAAWAVRSAGYATKAIDGLEPIAAVVQDDQWGMAMEARGAGEPGPRRNPARDPGRVGVGAGSAGADRRVSVASVVAGGRSRGDLVGPHGAGLGGGDDAIFVRGGDGLRQRLGAGQLGPGVVLQLGPQDPAERVLDLKRRRELTTRLLQTQAEESAAQQIARDTRLPPEQRAAAAAQIEAIRAERGELAAELEQINARQRGLVPPPARP
ncbi:MAG: PDZ domain-containing protein [Phycisphaerales bacterium]